MNALSLLCELIAQGGKASATLYSDNPDFSALLRHGYLRESGLVASVVCNDCEEAHAAPVVFEGGRYGHYCSDLGFVPLEKASLSVVLPEMPRLIDRLADVWECKRRRTSPLIDRTWRIGAAASDTGDVMLYFHPRLRDEDDARALSDALAREVRSPWRLVITAEGRLPVAETQIVDLSELVELDPYSGQLVPVADPVALVGAPTAKKAGAPNRYGEMLSMLIRARITAGEALSGRNEEAKAVLALFSEQNPGATPPSLPTVKSYVTKERAG